MANSISPVLNIQPYGSNTWRKDFLVTVSGLDGTANTENFDTGLDSIKSCMISLSNYSGANIYSSAAFMCMQSGAGLLSIKTQNYSGTLLFNASVFGPLERS